jgi:DNA-binding MarR family transcriptional regulator
MPTNRSLQSFFEHQDSGDMGRQERVIYDFIRSHHSCSRSDIERSMNIRINAVTGRVKSLIDNKKVCVIGTKYDPKTRKEVECLGATAIFEVFGGLKE